MKQNLKTITTEEEWETPYYLFKQLDDEFHFNLDPCATDENHKCEKYFTKADDGLSQDWGGFRVFCNPPYGRKIKDWIRKAYEESFKPETIVVLLVFAKTDTKWFHDYILHRAEVRFIKGRVRYGNSKTNAPYPSMVVVFRSACM